MKIANIKTKPQPTVSFSASYAIFNDAGKIIGLFDNKVTAESLASFFNDSWYSGPYRVQELE